MRKNEWGNSLAVQWLGLGTFTAVSLVQSLVRELRSHKLPKKKKSMNEQEESRSS